MLSIHVKSVVFDEVLEVVVVGFWTILLIEFFQELIILFLGHFSVGSVGNHETKSVKNWWVSFMT